MRRAAVSVLLAVAALSGAARAEGQKLSVGVFLPASVPGGEDRFKLAEALASAMTARMGRPVSARAFAKWEDLLTAAEQGTLDCVLVEAFAAPDRPGWTPVATAALGADERPRWGVVTRGNASLASLAGKRVAVVRGPGSSHAAFLRQAVFGGDLPEKRFEVVPVPSVESALKVVESGSADAALVPVPTVPDGLNVVYRSPRLPGPVMLSLRGDAAALRSAVTSLPAVSPLGAFSAPRGELMSELKRLLKGSARAPFMAESPTWRPDVKALVQNRLPAPQPPSLLEVFTASAELPDD